MEWYEKKRGRPFGAKTKASTPGKKRALEFAYLVHERRLKPTKSAKDIADKFDVDAYQVFKDFKRHLSVVIDEMIAASPEKIGPNMPTDAKVFIRWVALTSLRGQRID